MIKIMQNNCPMSRLFTYIFDLPFSLYFNFRYLPFSQAIHFPILISRKTQTRGLIKGCLQLKQINFAVVKYGIEEGSYGNPCNNNNYLICTPGSKIIFNGTARFAKGVTLRVDNNGIIQIGNRFSSNQNFSCFSNTEITIGDNLMAGWNVNVRDSDGHPYYDNCGKTCNKPRPIWIGNKVWLGSHCDILKGAIVPNGCIVGFKSLITKPFTEENSIIAGNPAKIIKRDIFWNVN